MAKSWTYTRGEWTEIPTPWNEYPQLKNIEDMRLAAGYKHWGDLGDEEKSSVYMHVFIATTESVVTVRWKYYVEFSLLAESYFEEVWIADLPSLLQFLREFGPIFQTEVQGIFVSFLKATLTKVFQVWHGHDAEEPCSRCDPNEINRRNVRRKARQAIRASNTH